MLFALHSGRIGVATQSAAQGISDLYVRSAKTWKHNVLNDMRRGSTRRG